VKKKLGGLTCRQLEELDTEVLDEAAFGFKSGDVVLLPLSAIHIVYPDDLESAEADIPTRRDALAVRRAFGRLPVEVHLRDGLFDLEDGHHRYVALRMLGDKSIWAEIEIKDNPIDVILGKKPRPKR
jgi:hypothetical protein